MAEGQERIRLDTMNVIQMLEAEIGDEVLMMFDNDTGEMTKAMSGENLMILYPAFAQDAKDTNSYFIIVEVKDVYIPGIKH